MTSAGSLLVVDDNEFGRDALSRRLRQRGYIVAEACGGPSALALADEHAYDLVLLDVEMPGMSGLDVLARLRATRSRTELPVIMVTARTEGADIVEAFRQGANDYVTKPVDFAVAAARIDTHLAHKRAVAMLRESEERYALAVQGANDGLWDWNLATNEVYWSPRWKAMIGFAESDLSPDPDEWLTRVHRDDVERVRAGLDAYLKDASGHFACEHRVLHRDGTFRWMLCRSAAVRNADGRATRLAGSLTDVTETKVADALTGLPNRLLFIDLVDRSIKRKLRRPDHLFALLVLGLDRFKIVSASLGRVSADELLVAVARRLQASLRATDAVARDERTGITLARLGSDEFTVLLDDITDASDAVRVAERLQHSLAKPFDIDGQQVFTSATVGIVVADQSYERPDEILRDAAIALQRGKANGATVGELFDPAMRERALHRLLLETELRHAIDARAFELHYQPIVSLKSRAIVGFESLIRWRHPVRGLLPPGDFIPVAETTGMVLPIGRLTLNESCRQMAAWQRHFAPDARSSICVNVSSRQFADAHFAGEIESVLQDTGLDASHLKLEITESAFIDDVQAAQKTLKRIQAIGVEWSLDDFGTGYSSLSYLHRLTIDTLKVDRSFVSRIGQDEHGTEMVRTIVTLAHNLGMDVVAEGVETAEQLAQVEALGCDYAQGFYFSRPVATQHVDALILSQPWQFAGPLAQHAAARVVAVRR